MAAIVQSRPNTCPRNNGNGCKQRGECREVVYQIVLEESTDLDTDGSDESDESVFSIQAETTVSAKDSSDISTCGSCNDGDELEGSSRGEFDVASSSPQTWPHPWSYDQNVSSESSPHQLKLLQAVDNEMVFSDNELSADEGGNYGCSDDFSDSDDDIFGKEIRFTYCVMCSSLNRNPSFQFCDTCYQIKKGFFPEKPAAKKKRRTSNRSQENMKFRKKIKSSQTNIIPSTAAPNPVGDVLSSSICNINCEVKVVASDANTATSNRFFEVASEPICADTTDSGFESRASNSRIKCNSSNECDASDKCLACLLNPTNALFLHGKTGHRCCCYRCAKRIWFQSRRCPICRSRVANIIRILNV